MESIPARFLNVGGVECMCVSRLVLLMGNQRLTGHGRQLSGIIVAEMLYLAGNLADRASTFAPISLMSQILWPY